MTDAERKALVERLRRWEERTYGPLGRQLRVSEGTLQQAADQIEADGQRIAELEEALSWALIQLGSETGYKMEGPVWHAYDDARNVLNGVKK